MNLEPKATAFLAAMSEAGLPAFERGTPEQARAILRTMRPARAARTMLSVTDLDAPRGEVAVPVRLYRPAATVPGCIVFFHGGGWVLGDIEGSDGFARELAFATGWAVASVSYRLAPEFAFPCGLDDADAALQWLNTHCSSLFGDDAAIVVMGDSAGGNLAAVLALRARDRGAPPIAGQILAYPVTDAGMDTESYRLFADGPILSERLMAWFWSHYISRAELRGDPEASPLRASTLAALPPTFVLTAENDILRDEGEAYAAALDAAGVAVRQKRYGGQIHGFVTMVGVFGGGAEALRDIADFLRSLRPSD